jgi:shikimate dehydrogenase
VTADVSRRVGLIGWPVKHSLSPAMHNAAFQALGLGWWYELLPVPPGQLGGALAGLSAGDFGGANVTVPHKSAVMAYLDEIDDAARSIGAVNTISVQGKRLLGHNTDAAGFVGALREAGLEPSGRRALVLGAGGAARAVAYALGQAGCAVAIYNRTVKRAAELVHDMQGLGLCAPVAWVPGGTALDELDLARFDLLVNATAAGMWPNSEDTPWPEALSLPSHLTVFDLVYNPLETRLLRQARQAGARTIDGLGMLVWQGALAFELWTGQKPPADLMRAAALDALEIRR